jgi:hypothetical protein
MTDKEIDPFDYGYTKDQVSMINSYSLLGVIDFCQKVIDSQPTVAALLVYPEKTDIQKDEDGNTTLVDVEWKEHNASSFFSTASLKGGGVPIMTSLALMAEQIKHALGLIHIENIRIGAAKKSSEIKEQEALGKLS